MNLYANISITILPYKYVKTRINEQIYSLTQFPLLPYFIFRFPFRFVFLLVSVQFMHDIDFFFCDVTVKIDGQRAKPIKFDNTLKSKMKIQSKIYICTYNTSCVVSFSLKLIGWLLSFSTYFFSHHIWIEYGIYYALNRQKKLQYHFSSDLLPSTSSPLPPPFNYIFD